MHIFYLGIRGGGVGHKKIFYFGILKNMISHAHHLAVRVYFYKKHKYKKQSAIFLKTLRNI